MEFRAAWEIDIGTENPKAAAQETRALQLKPTPQLTVCDAWEPTAGKMHRIDVTRDIEGPGRAELFAVRAAYKGPMRAGRSAQHPRLGNDDAHLPGRRRHDV
jgi:hypothetical protein